MKLSKTVDVQIFVTIFMTLLLKYRVSESEREIFALVEFYVDEIAKLMQLLVGEIYLCTLMLRNYSHLSRIF
jgi:hypothetical protein